MFYVRTYVGGLPNLFKKQNCVIKYMVNYPILKKQCRIFSNYINMFIQVFKGLQYLHSNEIVHGDVKGVEMCNIDLNAVL